MLLIVTVDRKSCPKCEREREGDKAARENNDDGHRRWVRRGHTSIRSDKQTGRQIDAPSPQRSTTTKRGDERMHKGTVGRDEMRAAITQCRTEYLRFEQRETQGKALHPVSRQSARERRGGGGDV